MLLTRARCASVAALTSVLAASACSIEPSAVPEPVAASATRACPLGVAGAAMGVTEVVGGVEIEFTAPSAVDELRLRVRDAAVLHGPDMGSGLGHDGRHDGGKRHGLRLWRAPDLVATVEDVAGGATLRLLARDPAQAESVRAHVLERANELECAPCG